LPGGPGHEEDGEGGEGADVAGLRARPLGPLGDLGPPAGPPSHQRPGEQAAHDEEHDAGDDGLHGEHDSENVTLPHRSAAFVPTS
jgi:hypothetical protein